MGKKCACRFWFPRKIFFPAMFSPRNIFSRDFRFSFLRESSFPQRIPGSELWNEKKEMQKSGAGWFFFFFFFLFKPKIRVEVGRGCMIFSPLHPSFSFTPLSQVLFPLLHQHNSSMLYSLTHFAHTSLPPSLFLPTPSFPSFSVFLSVFVCLLICFRLFVFTSPPHSLIPKINKMGGGGGEGGLSTKKSRGDKLAVRQIQLRADKPPSSRPSLSDQSPTLTSTHDMTVIKRYWPTTLRPAAYHLAPSQGPQSSYQRQTTRGDDPAKADYPWGNNQRQVTKGR